MSTLYRDPRSERPRTSRHFWLPVWIAVLGCAGAALYMLGGEASNQEWLRKKSADLAVRAMSDPAGALGEAEKSLESGDIDFSLYSRLLEVALGQTDANVRASAFRSMDKLLASGRAYANDLRNEVASMPPQVLIATTESRASAASGVERELKMRGMDVFVVKTSDPNGASKTEVRCYDPDSCRQTAQTVVDVLQESGYAVAKPTPPDNGAAPDDQGAQLFNKKRIEIALADDRKSATSKQVVFVARHLRPHVPRVRQVVAFDGGSARRP